MDGNKMIGTVMGIVIAVIVIATVLPTGIETLTNSTWSDPTVSLLMVTLLPIIIVMGIIMLFLSRDKKK